MIIPLTREVNRTPEHERSMRFGRDGVTRLEGSFAPVLQARTVVTPFRSPE